MFLYFSFKWFYNIVGFFGGEKTYFRLIVIDVDDHNHFIILYKQNPEEENYVSSLLVPDEVE